MVSCDCDIVFVTDFDFVFGVFVIGLVQLLYAKKIRNCGLKNFFYLEYFACLVVVFRLLIFTFGNLFVNILAQQMILILIE